MSVQLITVGSIAYDEVETPQRPLTEQLGGSAVYFTLAAAPRVKAGIVGVVGDDFKDDDRALLTERGVLLDGMETETGRTFRWGGRYDAFLKERDTLFTELGVFEAFHPHLPETWKKAPYLFLGNIHPALQNEVLDGMERPTWVGADTMNFWIEGWREELDRLIGRINGLFINDSEATLLTGEQNMARAGRMIQEMGPSTVLIKRGEFGALVFSDRDMYAAPAVPLEEVRDPTGAGDSFAGGFMAEVSETGDVSPEGIRRAVAAGTVTASFCVQGFGPRHMAGLTREALNERLDGYAKLVRLPERRWTA